MSEDGSQSTHTREKMATQKKKRPMMGVRKFRDVFQTLTEPVEVIRATGQMERLGVWIPEKTVSKENQNVEG